MQEIPRLTGMYREYLEKSSEIARRKLRALIDGPAWDKMPDKRKTEVVSAIVGNARKGIRQRIKAEMAREARRKAAEAKGAPTPI